MKARKQSPAQAGFTLIELLVVIAIIAVLIAMRAPMHRVNRTADLMMLDPQLRSLGTQIRDFNRTVESNAEAFLLNVGDLAADATDPDTTQVDLGPLQSFCSADTQLSDLQGQVDAMLSGDTRSGNGISGGGLVQTARRALLTEAKDGLAHELPAVQKLGNLLRKKGGDVCPATIE